MVFFTNHSLRRSSATRLFQAVVDKKIIREITGHKSDTLDKYAVTSDAQKTEISRILAGNKKESSNSKSTAETKLDSNDGKINLEDNSKCSCSSSKKVLNSGEIPKIGEMIENIVSKKKGCRTLVKIEIKIMDENE